MAWVLDNSAEEESDEDSFDGWVLDEPSSSPQQQETQKPISLSGFLTEGLEGAGDILRSFNPAVAEAITRPISTMTQAMSGSIMPEIAQQESGRDSLSLRDAIDQLSGGSTISKTSQERIAENVAGTAADFATLGKVLPFDSSIPGELKTGALFGGGESVAEELGAGEFGKLGTGLAFALSPAAILKGKKSIGSAIEWAKNVWKSEGKELGENVPAFLKEAGTPKAMADLELSKRDVVGRVAKTSNAMLEEASDRVANIAEPSFKDIGTFRAADIEKGVIEANKKSILDTVSPIDVTNKKGWEGVLNVVEERFDAAKSAYKGLYDVAKDGAKGLEENPENVMEAAKKLKDKMKGSLISMAEEGSVKAAAETLVKKLIPEQGKLAEALVKDLAEEGIMSDFEEVLGMMNKLAEKEGLVKAIPVDQLMNTKRSISRILSKSDIIPAPVDLLRPVNTALKKDILKGLSPNPEALEAYEGAEKLFAETQNVFNNESMVKARKSSNPEELSSFFTKPSNIERLNKALGNEKSVKGLADRMIIDSISKKGSDAARELSKESMEYLSNNGQKALEKILESGNKLTGPGQLDLARSNMLSDLQKFTSTGSRPSYTLDLMKSGAGRKIVNDTLKTSPSGRKMLSDLRRLSVNDLVDSVMKDGHIDFERARDILSNPEVKALMRDALGEEGLKFFQNMEKYGKNMFENMNRLNSMEPHWIEKTFESLFSDSVKHFLYALTPFTGGKSLLAGLGIAGLKEGTKRARQTALFKIIESTKGRNSVKELGKIGMTPQKTKKYLKRFGQVLGQLSSEED